MKYCLFVLLLVVVLAMSANAGTIGSTWKWNFTGEQALTPQNHQSDPTNVSAILPGAIQPNLGWKWGWDNIEVPDNVAELEEGVITGGVGAIRVNDNEPATGGFQSFHSRFEVGENNGSPPATLLKWGNMTMFRAKTNGTISGYGIGAGYSTVDGNHTGILGIGNGTVNVVGWQNDIGPIAYDMPDGMGGSVKSLDIGPNTGWKVYALRMSVNPTSGTWYDIWVSNGSDWSANAGDWSHVASFHPNRSSSQNNAIPDTSADSDDLGRAEGPMIGSFGPSDWHPGGRTASGVLDIDWLNFANNPTGGFFNWDINPWYAQLAPIPEPASLLALGSGLIGMAGFAIRRKRA